MELEPGVVLAQRYRIQRQLGRGGMGEVFAAENIRTGRTVAVKVLRADSKQKSSAVARFRREARAAGAINSDYVTQVLDVEDDAEHGIVIVFELLEGESLIDRLKRTGPMTFDELFPIVEQVWMGLSDAHKAGVIHRDLKPSNVFLQRANDGTTRVKILDFGISKLPKEVGGDTLTEMGQSLGTFSFMPPEQIGKAKTVDHRADIYACATLIYQALSGQLPYAAKNILQMVDLKTKSEPRPLSSVLDGAVDPRLEAFLRKSLARNPDDRYQSGQEALEAWRELRGAKAALPQSAPQPAAPPQQAAQPSPGFAPPQNAHGGPYAQDPSRRQTPSPQHYAVQGSAPQYAGAAAYAQPPQQQSAAVPGGQRLTPGATVMLNDPRSAAPVVAPAGYARSVTPAPIPAQKFGGTVALPAAQMTPMPQSGAYPSAAKNISVPVVSADTTSEGGADQAATVAMPLRQVAMQAQSGSLLTRSSSSIPRVHDDNPDQGGTQLMSHAMRATPNPAHQAPRPAAGTPVSPMAGQMAQAQKGPAPGVNQAAPSAPGEADLTTVYRRDKAVTQPGRPPPTQSSPEPRGSRVGIILGVLAFALVGFAVAAAVIHYLQTGRMIWQ